MSPTIPRPPRRSLDWPTAERRDMFWNTIWSYADHQTEDGETNDYSEDALSDIGIEYASFVMAPYDQPGIDRDIWFEGAVHVQSLFESSFWLGRAGKSDTFIDQLMSQVTDPDDMATAKLPAYLTREIMLRAVIHGSEFGRWSIGHDLDWVWGVWQFGPYSPRPVAQ